ncbi:MAG TPA: VanZ family protein [Candidatus Limiplasma sp.]|nr:VanZ family protein [Candidatus Limiplasma sp.]
MQKYIDAMLTAARLFPLVALMITIPYFIVQYHRYGSVLLLRMAVWYSFILYMMCVVFLTMLPIPASASDAAAQHTQPQYIPLQSIRSWLSDAGFSLLDPSTWKDTFYSRSAFILFANVVMMVPLGIYLRYYFTCNFGKTLVITFGFSLILELIQLSGLFGLYSVAYRTFDVDDLLTNTLGGVIGFWLARPLMRILPSQETLNAIAYRKGQHVSVVRRLTAAAADWLLLGLVILLALYADTPLRQYLLARSWKWQLTGAGILYAVLVLTYFIVGEWLLGGRTIGKRITHLRCVDARSGRRPTLRQCFIKYAFLYLGYPSLPLTAALILIVIVKKYLLESQRFTYGFGLMVLYGLAVTAVMLRVLIRKNKCRTQR